MRSEKNRHGLLIADPGYYGRDRPRGLGSRSDSLVLRKLLAADGHDPADLRHGWWVFMSRPIGCGALASLGYHGSYWETILRYLCSEYSCVRCAEIHSTLALVWPAWGSSMSSTSGRWNWLSSILRGGTQSFGRSSGSAPSGSSLAALLARHTQQSTEQTPQHALKDLVAQAIASVRPGMVWD